MNYLFCTLSIGGSDDGALASSDLCMFFLIVLLNIVVSTWCACNFRIDASELLQFLQLRVLVVGDAQNFLLNCLLFLFHEQ